MKTKLELLKISGCQEPKMINNSFSNVTMMQNGLIYYETIDGGIFDSITLNDVHLLGSLKMNLITFISYGAGQLHIKNFDYLKGSIHDQKTLISLSNPTGETLLSTATITNVSSSLSSSYLKLLSSKNSTLSSIIFTNASTSSDSDTTNILLNLIELSSPSTSTITFNSVQAVNCKTSVISIHNSLQSTPIDQYITINDLVIRDLYYPNPPYIIEVLMIA